jgi:hypothetical protein
VRLYLCKVTGISRAQMTHLIAQYRVSGRIEDRRDPFGSNKKMRFRVTLFALKLQICAL